MTGICAKYTFTRLDNKKSYVFIDLSDTDKDNQ